MSDYTADSLRERARSYEEMAGHARQAETKHRIAASNAPNLLARYAAQALMQASACTARHWGRLAEQLDRAGDAMDDKEREATKVLNPTEIA